MPPADPRDRPAWGSPCRTLRIARRHDDERTRMRGCASAMRGLRPLLPRPRRACSKGVPFQTAAEVPFLLAVSTRADLSRLPVHLLPPGMRAFTPNRRPLLFFLGALSQTPQRHPSRRLASLPRPALPRLMSRQDPGTDTLASDHATSVPQARARRLPAPKSGHRVRPLD